PCFGNSKAALSNHIAHDDCDCEARETASTPHKCNLLASCASDVTLRNSRGGFAFRRPMRPLVLATALAIATRVAVAFLHTAIARSTESRCACPVPPPRTPSKTTRSKGSQPPVTTGAATAPCSPAACRWRGASL